METMISECAVEPQVMAEWRYFEGLHAEFGVGNGRLLCEFPRKWKKEVLETARRLEREGRNSPIQTQRIIDQFQHGAFRRALVSSNRDYHKESSWCDAAQTVSEPFDLIISSREPSSENELQAGEFIRTDPPFARPRQKEVRRNAEDLISAGWPCFRKAKEIMVVDPYFRPLEANFGKVLGHFIVRLANEKSSPPRFEVHTKLPDPYYPEIHQKNWQKWADDNLPPGWTLEVIHWERVETGGNLHARYILTNLGGLDYNWGTDEAPDEWTQIALLDDIFWKRLFRRFKNREMVEPDRVFTVER